MAAGHPRGGTVLAAPNFHGGERAAIKLQKAIKGIGTDEKVIIEVLLTHTNVQRQEIRKKYKALYGRDLMDDMKAELGGHFEEICSALLTSTEDYLAECLNGAIKGSGTDEWCLIDILCTQKPSELDSLVNVYKDKYGLDLESSLKEETSGTFKTLVRSLLSGGREQSTVEDEERVHTDIQDLVKANDENDEQTFAAILNVRSYEHLKHVFETYSKVTGKNIEEDVKNIFSGDAQNGYLALVKVMKNEQTYFAERLQSIVKGVGTDDTSLIRITVTHSESDLADIKDRFKQLYGKDLAEVVADDTSGDYRKILMKLLASN